MSVAWLSLLRLIKLMLVLFSVDFMCYFFVMLGLMLCVMCMDFCLVINHKPNIMCIPLPSRQVSGKNNTIMYGSTKPEDDILGRGFRRNFCSEKKMKSALLVPY